jgi:diadenosine tetraphosphate (Ap4A) HIT family hydrolase
MAAAPECILCRGGDGDAELNRVEVWRDDLWRLTISLESEVPGFAYLEPHRHIPFITDLDGPEAASLGPVLARTTSVLQAQTNAELVYIYVFGAGIPHLHFHLAPHRAGDALNTQLIRGEVVEERLPSGAGRITSKEFPPLPEAELRAAANRVREMLASG